MRGRLTRDDAKKTKRGTRTGRGGKEDDALQLRRMIRDSMHHGPSRQSSTDRLVTRRSNDASIRNDDVPALDPRGSSDFSFAMECRALLS